MNLWQDDMPAFRPAAFQVRRAESAWELGGHHRLREDFFCRQQRIFEGTDRDRIDLDAIPLVAVTLLHGEADEVVGAVRIHQEAPGLWWGSRLCVAATIRGDAGLGTALIRFAVGTANALGSIRFLAHVQVRNVRLFQRCGWHVCRELELHGRPHALMEAELDQFPPVHAPSPVHLPTASLASARSPARPPAARGLAGTAAGLVRCA